MIFNRRYVALQEQGFGVNVYFRTSNSFQFLAPQRIMGPDDIQQAVCSFVWAGLWGKFSFQYLEWCYILSCSASGGTLFFSGEKEKVERKPLSAYSISSPIYAHYAEIEKTCLVRNVNVYFRTLNSFQFLAPLHIMSPDDVQQAVCSFVWAKLFRNI